MGILMRWSLNAYCTVVVELFVNCYNNNKYLPTLNYIELNIQHYY